MQYFYDTDFMKTLLGYAFQIILLLITGWNARQHTKALEALHRAELESERVRGELAAHRTTMEEHKERK